MRFRSIDSLRDFEYHDSMWRLADHSSATVSFEVKALNLLQHAPQNPESCDMEIETARVSFTGFRLAAYEPDMAWTTDASGNSCPTEPIKTYTGDEAIALFLREAKYEIWVYALAQADSGEWVLSGCGEEPYFEVRFSFGQVTIEWDAFRCPAWYVLRSRGIKA
ncbi:MAG: hypothetical protein IKP32_04030 [Clostridia bacterium]|nr:hypothetical protein [Clostridia bacterium]